MRNNEYYEILGVARDATKEQIQKAYRKLARKYHPDVNKEADAADTFKKINEAHSVLADPEKRKLYDQYGTQWQEAQHQQQNGQQWSSNDHGWQDYGGGFRYEQGAGNPFEEGDFRDFFSDIFGRGRGGSEQRSWGGFQDMPGRTVEAELEVTLDELVHGASKTISWSSMERDGGIVRPRENTVQLKVPKGLKDGSVIRLAGKGEKGSGEGEPGDLLLRINVRPDDRFTLDDYDLITTVPIAPWEAALGGKVDVDTVGGRISLTIPKGCYTGRKLRVKGKGLPRKKGGAGDLIVRVEVHVPKNLSAEEESLFEELKRKSRYNPRSTLGQWAAENQKEAA